MKNTNYFLFTSIVLLFLIQLATFYYLFQRPRYEIKEFKFDKIPLLVKFDNHTGEIRYRSITSFSDDSWEVIDEKSNLKLTSENVRKINVKLMESSFIENSGYDYGNTPYFKLSISNDLDFDIRNLYFRAIFSSDKKIVETVSVKKIKVLIPDYLHILEFKSIKIPWKRKVNLEIFIGRTQNGPWFKSSNGPFTLDENNNQKNTADPLNGIIWDEK